MTVHVVTNTTADGTRILASCASLAGAERLAIRHMAAYLGREPWVQTGSAAWELKAERQRVSIVSCPVEN